MSYTGTYSPDDNKLRLYASSRLDAETYARVKSAGFRWAPKQELFFATWSPTAEDLLTDLAGEIDDDDQSLTERAEERAERFSEYSENRAADSERARQAVSSIADNIPFGQPILVGHHSERHARRDAAKIENGMRKTVKFWEQSAYWQDRAAGAIRNAKYKERPDVRARRIKTLEADLRKQERTKADAEKLINAWQTCGPDLNRALSISNYDHISMCFPLADYPRDPPASQYEGMKGLWSALTDGIINADQAAALAIPAHERTIARAQRWIDHYNNRLTYERAMLEDAGGLVADKVEFEVGGKVLDRHGEWLTILRLNKKDGILQSISTTIPRYWGMNSYVLSAEKIKEYKPPVEGATEKIKAATKLAPICNYPGEGFLGITQAQWDEIYKDHRGTTTRAATETAGAHRIRNIANFKARQLGATTKDPWGNNPVWITDAKRKDAPPPLTSAPAPTLAELAPREVEPRAPRPTPAPEPEQTAAAQIEKMKDQLKEGIKVVSAPQLYPTPPELAARMVDEARPLVGHRVLEPSAGTGSLLKALPGLVPFGDCKQTACDVVAVEINGNLSQALESAGLAQRVICTDFLGCTVEGEPSSLGRFDRIIMNPPFTNGADIKHIQHARKFMKPGGRLVALCAAGPRQRAALEPDCDSWEDLPAGSFAAEGTGVNVALVVFDAPEAPTPDIEAAPEKPEAPALELKGESPGPREAFVSRRMIEGKPPLEPRRAFTSAPARMKQTSLFG